MLSSRPYLARALYEWLLDNDHTPYIVVDAEGAGVQVPEQFVQNGQIVLNIAPGAVRELDYGQRCGHLQCALWWTSDASDRAQ